MNPALCLLSTFANCGDFFGYRALAFVAVMVTRMSRANVE